MSKKIAKRTVVVNGKGVYDLTEMKDLKGAKKDGDILYYEKPCEKGHKAPRYVRDGVCKECYRLKRLAKKEKFNNQILKGMEAALEENYQSAVNS